MSDPKIPYDWARVQCPKCGAAVDTRCRARSGRTTDAHIDRTLAAARSARCG